MFAQDRQEPVASHECTGTAPHPPVPAELELACGVPWSSALWEEMLVYVSAVFVVRPNKAVFLLDSWSASGPFWLFAPMGVCAWLCRAAHGSLPAEVG